MRTTYVQDSSSWPLLWQEAYKLLQEKLVANQLLAWIQPLEMVETQQLDQNLKVTLSAPNDFLAEWVRDHYQSLIETALSQVSGVPCSLSILIRKKPQAEMEDADLQRVSYNAESPTGAVLSAGNLHANRDPGPAKLVGIDSRYTFETFVVGASNQFAHASAIAVAERPAHQYNPLFIYSPPGLGKTHLLHAIGNHLLEKNPDVRIAYISAESFVNEMIESIQHNRMSKFRNKYRDSYDVLLIDDIQFIAGKGKSEEEFFHTFNALHTSKRQIILTSDRPPKDIEGLEERIRTRFEWGLVADIHPPEIETRIAILRAKAEHDDIYLHDEVATFLATYIKSNVRELEGILIRLQAQASLTGAEISLEMAKQQLKSYVPEEGSILTVETIQNTVAKHYNLRVQELKSTQKTKTVALARQIAMYLIRKYTGLGFKEIGQYFGGKDHTTIMHAFRKIESALETDETIRDAVETIQNQL